MNVPVLQLKSGSANPFRRPERLTFPQPMVSRPSVENKVVRIPLQFSANTVRVMSYNAYNFFDASRNPEIPMKDLRQVKSVKSIKAMAEVIKSQNPDILALQEVEGRAVLEDLNQNYLDGQYPNIIVFPTNDGRGIRVAFMAKETVRAVDVQSHRNDRSGGRPTFQRDFLEATFETSSGFRFTLFNTHYKSMVGGEVETTPIRLTEARRSREIINDRITADPSVRILMVGDLNSKYYSRYGRQVIDTLEGATEKDPKRKLVELTENEGWPPLTHDGRKVYPDNKLDYVFANPPMAKLAQAEVVGEFRKKPYSLASDHLPLLVTVTEPDTKSGTLPVTFSGRKKAPMSTLQPATWQRYA